MKPKITQLILLFTALITPYQAQQSYDYLIKYLPTIEKTGQFQKSEIIIDDPCQECLPTVAVLYQNKGVGDVGEDYSDLGQTISLSITDCKGANEYLNSMLEFNVEFQSALVINEKYNGWMEKIENEFGVQECIYTYSVADRFLIQINGGKGDVFNEMNQLAKTIDYNGLGSLK